MPAWSKGKPTVYYDVTIFNKDDQVIASRSFWPGDEEGVWFTEDIDFTAKKPYDPTEEIHNAISRSFPNTIIDIGKSSIKNKS